MILCCEKCVKENKHKSVHLDQKYARIVVHGHYLFLEIHSFLFVSRKRKRTADKYPRIFLRQLTATTFIAELRRPKAAKRSPIPILGN